MEAIEWLDKKGNRVMKCPACKYEYDEEKDKKKKSKPRFFQIETEHKFKTFVKSDISDYWKDGKEYKINLYGCPKCNAMIYEIGEEIEK